MSTDHKSQHTQNTALGIALMCLGFFCFSVSDVAAKMLTNHFHATQIAWFRQLGLFTGVLILLVLKGPGIYKTNHLGTQIFRGFMSAITPVFFIFAIAHMALADAVAVTFVAPFIVIIIGALVLKERLTNKQLLGIVGAFIGTLIVIRPSSGVFQPAVIFILLSSVAFAMRQIVSRLIAGSDSSSTTVAYGGTVSVLSLGVIMPFVWQTPTTMEELGLLLVLAGAAGFAEFFLIRGLDVALAVILSPMQYTLILWSSIWGWLFFADLPDIWTLIGSAVIILSGILSSGVLKYLKRGGR